MHGQQNIKIFKVNSNKSPPHINTIDESVLSCMVNSKNVTIIYNEEHKQFSFYLIFVSKHCSPLVYLKG